MKPMPRRVYALLATALAVVLFFAVNIVSQNWLRAARIDLTEHKVYTLSQGTRAMLSKMTDPVTLRFYFSRDIAKDYAQVNTYATRVSDLLHEYVTASGGKLLLEEINPEPFSAQEDEAMAQGLSAAPTTDGSMIYFGLVGTNTLDGRETIPFFSTNRASYLEYDLSSAIYRLSQAKKPKLGIISALPLQTGTPGIAGMLSGDNRTLVLYDQLRENFDVLPMSLSIDKIPDDIGTLIVAHPSMMTKVTQYAVDQFVLRGGHAIIFVDPYSELVHYTPSPTGVSMGDTSDFQPLLKAWGVAYDSSKVVADPEHAIRVAMRSNPNSQGVDYVVWLKMTNQDVDQSDPVTASLQEINFASTGFLNPAAGATTRFTPLIQTSMNSGLIDAKDVIAERDPQNMLQNFVSQMKRFTLAARVQGPVKTAFPEGPPANDVQLPAGVALAPQDAQIKEAANINVIVVADSDLFDDRFWVQTQNVLGKTIAVPIADNSAFVQNAVENMMGSSDLISLRTRAPDVRSFDVVTELRRAAESQFAAEAQQLQTQITQTEARIRALEGQEGEQQAAAKGAELLSPQSQAEVEKFRRDLISVRARLRDVQANLRRDVESLGNFLAFIDIMAVPLLVAAAAIILALLRRRRRAQARGLT